MNGRVRAAARAIEGRLACERGQTFTEYTMILGLLTAIVLSVTAIIVPGLGRAVVGLVDHMLVYMGSPAS